MTTFRILILLACFITLSGCAVSSLKLSDTERVSFYDPPDDKALVSVFLACGKQAVNGDYDSPGINLFSFNCDYNLNSVNYSRLWSDKVGRVNVPAGELIINNSGGKEPTKVIVVKPGEKILLVTDVNIIQGKGVHFGVIGMAIEAAYDAANPPAKKPIIFPLKVYKNEFMNLISTKEPVQVIVVKDK